MAELQKVDDWLSALLANLEPAARSRMMRQLAQELRRTQQQNIRMQRNPDGSSYEPRRVTARSKKGRIKRQMFTKLRTTKYLKTAASADSASVQFEGKVQRIARVHHYGLRDRVSRKGPQIRYAKRRYVRRPVTSFPLKLVSVLSSGCLPASALSIVVAKFGSFPSAAASSFSVSSAAGAEPTIAAIADFTNAVVAICVLLTDCAAVGAVGVPVSAGLDSGAFSASALLMVGVEFYSKRFMC